MTDTLADRPDEWTIDWRHKGFPPDADGVPASHVGDKGWNVLRDFMTPIALLKRPALTHNLAAMRAYCDAHDVALAPHGKTTMSPELIRLQLDHGAWGITAATAWQARVFAEFGVRRIMIANECLDPHGLRWISTWADATPDGEILVFADSLPAVRALDAALPADAVRPLPVVVEMGPLGGRAGARMVDEAVAVGHAIATSPGLELAGVGGFEGIIGTGTRDDLAPVRRLLLDMRTAVERLMTDTAIRADRPAVLTAGGSTYFDQVVDVFTHDRTTYPSPVEVVIRSGCYLTHDHGAYAQASPFDTAPQGPLHPAIEVWARVLSTPEEGLAIIDAGKRDVSTDGLMPVVLGRYRDGRREPVDALFDHCNDQHGYVRVPDGDALQPGDLVALGISHPCTTFDKWRAIPVVDDAYEVVSAIRTLF